jgi:outer membrane lipoprotein
MKVYAKVGAFTRRFLDELGVIARRAFRGGDVAKLAAIGADAGRAARKLGPGPLRSALAAVEDSEDLARLARSAERDPAGTYALASVFGRSALRLLTPDAANLTAVLRLVKTATRAVKIGDKTIIAAPVEALPWIFGFALLILAVVAFPYRMLRRGRRAAAGLFAALVAAMLAGCQTLPEEVRTPVGPALEQVRENPAAHAGQTVRWGGTVAQVENRQSQTWLHVVGRALDSYGRPFESDHSPGRFIARATGFLDPEIYARGREVTIRGRFAEVITSQVGEFPYPMPVMDAETVFLWERRPDPAPYWPYYDPFYPWWGYPWGYPYRYPYHPRW